MPLFVKTSKAPYSWDEYSEKDYQAWVPTASLSHKQAAIELMTVFVDGIVAGKGRGIPLRDVRSVYSAEKVEVDLYRATRKFDMCMYAGIHQDTRQCRLVIIGPCTRKHQWSLATHRIGNWRVYKSE